MSYENIMLAVITALIPLSVWVLKTIYSNVLKSSFDEQLEKFKIEQTKILEEYKDDLEREKTLDQIYSQKVNDIYSKLLPICGELKTLGFGQEMGTIKTLDTTWFYQTMYDLEYLGQTWWPYFTNTDIKDSILKLRHKIYESKTHDPSTDTTTFAVHVFWDHVENLQILIRDELAEIYSK